MTKIFVTNRIVTSDTHLPASSILLCCVVFIKLRQHHQIRCSFLLSPPVLETRTTGREKKARLFIFTFFMNKLLWGSGLINAAVRLSPARYSCCCCLASTKTHCSASNAINWSKLLRRLCLC